MHRSGEGVCETPPEAQAAGSFRPCRVLISSRPTRRDPWSSRHVIHIGLSGPEREHAAYGSRASHSRDTRVEGRA